MVLLNLSFLFPWFSILFSTTYITQPTLYSFFKSEYRKEYQVGKPHQLFNFPFTVLNQQKQLLQIKRSSWQQLLTVKKSRMNSGKTAALDKDSRWDAAPQHSHECWEGDQGLVRNPQTIAYQLFFSFCEIIYTSESWLAPPLSSHLLNLNCILELLN